MIINKPHYRWSWELGRPMLLCFREKRSYGFVVTALMCPPR